MSGDVTSVRLVESANVKEERVSQKPSGLVYGIIVVLAIMLVAFIAYSIQSSASATLDQQNFNSVNLQDGAKVHVNGNESLTFTNNNGSSLIADSTNGVAVKGEQIDSTLNSFSASKYGSDALFEKSVAVNPRSLSEAEFNAFKRYLTNVDIDYWLSDTGSRGPLTWQSYATHDNKAENNTLSVTGEVNGILYYDTQVATGSYAFNKDVNLNNYTSEVGGVWDLNRSANTVDFKVYHSNQTWLKNGDTIYNNLQLQDSGWNENGYRNADRKSTRLNSSH